MSDPYTIRLYEPGDEEEIVQLLVSVFEGWPAFDLTCSSLNHWIWKYQDYPFEKRILVAVNDNKIIGCEHRYYPRVKLFNEFITGSAGGDLAVHPDFWKKGISNKFLDIFHEIEKEMLPLFSYWSTGNLVLIKSYSKKFPRFPQLPIYLIKIHNIDKYVKNIKLKRPWLIKIGYLILNLMTNLSNIFRGNVHTNNINIKEIKEFDGRINLFMNTIEDEYDFIIERTKKFLNWRYCDSRGGKYIVKIAEENNDILGYIILRINKKKLNEGYIVDFLTMDSRIDAAECLLMDALRYFKKRNVNSIWYLGMNNNMPINVLKRHGFLNPRKNFLLFYRSIGSVDKINSLNSSLKKKYISFGDFDAI